MTEAQFDTLAIRLALLDIDLSLTIALAGLRVQPPTPAITSTVNPVETNGNASTEEKREEV